MNSHIENGSRYYSLKVKEIREETPEAVTIIFKNPGNEFDYKPGQYLTLILSHEGETIRRSYSLCSSPFHDEFPAITVKRIKGGTVSHSISETMHVGDVIEVMEPMGSFTIEIDPYKKRKIVLFAGGSGITPLISILKSVLLSEKESEILLLYQNRDESSIIFKEKLDQLKSEFLNRIRIEHILSRPSESWTGRKGRVTIESIKDILADEEIVNAEVFLCGPQGMMETVEKALDQIGFDIGKIRMERFFTSNAKKEKDNTEEGEEIVARKVSVKNDGEEFQYMVEPDSTILESGLDEDIDLPFSCQSGVCTACRGRLISGKVSMDDPDGLSDDEIAEGYILPCISHPLTDNVKIEIG
ncbi:2Fe-2S iron-sulfur cluster-binding protein [Bacteroidota bacterium]